MLMSEKFDLYKCQVCGNIVQVMISGDGELVCCSVPMTHLTPRSDENHELAEKHIPDAINIPNETIGTDSILELPKKDQLILVYCRSGIRSKQA